MAVVVIALSTVFSPWVFAASGTSGLVNPGFEQVDVGGELIGWTILSGLDPHRYGPPDLEHDFDEIVPAQGADGYQSPHCMSFPSEGTWSCPVFNHANGENRGINGKELGKAAAFQSVNLSAGGYRFAAWHRTATGAQYSAAFRLGINPGEPAEYAHDDSTGIRWTSSLGVRRAELGGMAGRGEWMRYQTEPFVVDTPGPVTVWIRFDYANENQFASRWQVDDVAIIAGEDESDAKTPHPPCIARSPIRFRSFPGDDKAYFIDTGKSEIVDASEKRLFRHARELQPGDSLQLSFPTPESRSDTRLFVCWSGPVDVSAGGLNWKRAGGPMDQPRTEEWSLASGSMGGRGQPFKVAITAPGPDPTRVYEVEMSSPGRTAIRLMNVEADVVDVPWIVGAWDATGREFTGRPWQDANRPDLRTNDLTEQNRWLIRFDHKPRSHHRCYEWHCRLF